MCGGGVADSSCKNSSMEACRRHEATIPTANGISLLRMDWMVGVIFAARICRTGGMGSRGVGGWGT